MVDSPVGKGFFLRSRYRFMNGNFMDFLRWTDFARTGQGDYASLFVGAQKK